MLHLLMLGLQDGNFLLHLADVAGGLGNLRSLQISLCQQLLNVLLLFLQCLLQGSRAGDLPGIARGGLRQLERTVKM